ncbi:RsmD family RNA methyltransferase [Salinimicrobium flavum]|uniref:RsmD family RNA methyltransferase n=1 Tax=Salinimicrobium flavum TaxID=1737065 RepID=A0ABW5J062_9FLAO
MRIVSGTHKGKKITAPKKLPVRPTTDFAKEALFNILNNNYHFSALKVIDLFSGTGNITYEFASRGAREIIAVDAHFECVKFINRITEELDMPVRTVKSDVFKYLTATGETADIIFADPPYNFDLEALSSIVETTFSRNLLNENGTLIIEHSKKMDLSSLEHFTVARKYGNSVFSFFE